MHNTATTMGLKTQPHALSIAGKWSALAHSTGDTKYIVIFLLIAAVLLLVMSVGKTARGR